jgi:tight adherence protein C
VVPSRLSVPTAILFAVAGFMAPDAIAQRRARQRRERFVAALPDALELLAVGSAAGRGAATLFGELSRGAVGPLASELGATVAAIECGMPPRVALQELRRRLPGAEVGVFAAAVERSRTLGSPLAEQLHLQAVALRRDARRRIEERAARAAPKIQLVVALVLVPSVLLVILAAILAHADALLAGI